MGIFEGFVEFWLFGARGGDSFAQWPLREASMARDGLFEDLPEQPGAERAAGRPRLREPERDQIELRAVDLDSLIGTEHPARVLWAYVEKLALSALDEAVRAREHTPGQAPASPRLLLALWLYATSQDRKS